MGIPVLVIESPSDYENAKQLLLAATKKDPVCLCPQRAALISLKNPSKDTTGKLLQNGAITYPGALEISLPVNPKLSEAMRSKDPKAFQNLMEGLEARFQLVSHKLSKFEQAGAPTASSSPETPGQSGIATVASVVATDPNMMRDKEMSLKQMIDRIATGDKSQARIALNSLLQALHSQLKNTIKHQKGSQIDQMILFELLAVSFAILDQINNRILPSLSTTQPSSMERLYHLKPLEALIFQTPSNEIV
ncbi:unnamed protein product, partial [Rotaria magnacalcarata]